jgi:catechol 2,3-dioxygenase-like lactoylglutathione lyase family enzyme
MVGSMTLNLLGLRTVIYPSPDLEAAKKWWSVVLGQAPSFDQPFYVGFQVGGYELGLLPDASVADGPLVYWGVTDVQIAIDDALAHGATERDPASDVGDGIVTGTVKSPPGNIIGFIFNPHFAVG